MNQYSNLIHKSDLLVYGEKRTWLFPELIDKKPNLQGILNRIHQTIKIINFTLTERDKQVNIYRKKMQNSEKLEDTFLYLILFTESYFTYVTTLLNAYAELFCEVIGNYPKEANENFPKLWDYLKNRSQNKEIHDYFQNKMLWYSVLIQLPRNKLVIHDKKTSGYGMNDHGIDVYVGKHATHDLDKNTEAIRLLQKIIPNHPEFKGIQIGNYFHPIYRQIVEKIDILNEKEIDYLINAGGIAGFDFPYIPQITPKLQDFINFVENRLVNKYQMCPKCKKPNLRIERMVINPQILKFDPKNIWFGWKCTTCSYIRKFNLS